MKNDIFQVYTRNQQSITPFIILSYNEDIFIAIRVRRYIPILMFKTLSSYNEILNTTRTIKAYNIFYQFIKSTMNNR